LGNDAQDNDEGKEREMRTFKQVLDESLTVVESKTRSFDYYRSDDNLESILIRHVDTLQRKGVPLKEKTLERYVLNNIEELDADDVFVDRLKHYINQ
jgi:hypothetical protein